MAKPPNTQCSSNHAPSDDAKVLQTQVPAELAGQRFDLAVARLFPDYSRSRIQQWIKTGNALLDGTCVPVRRKVHGGEDVTVRVVEPVEVQAQAQAIELAIVYEDDWVLVVNKPPGLVVHPGAGNFDGTLVNALLHHDAALSKVPRAGVVHRLDKDTSGLLVIARNLIAHNYLVTALKERTVKRQYDAIVCGVLTGGGKVDAPIGRHPSQRTKMTVRPNGRPARSYYRVRERFNAHTLVRIQLESGRTHQIRVHMAHIGYPVVGDQTYGGRLRLPAGASEALSARLRQFKRQALHAAQLEFEHPRDQEQLSFNAEMPQDMRDLVELLR